MREIAPAEGKYCGILALIGVGTVLVFGCMSVDFDGRVLTTLEAWELGVAQPYVFGGVSLVVLSLLLFSGARWPRWPILLWFPVTFGGANVWSIQCGVGNFDITDFLLEGLPVYVIWTLTIWRMFFRPSTVDSSDIGNN